MLESNSLGYGGWCDVGILIMLLACGGDGSHMCTMVGVMLVIRCAGLLSFTNCPIFFFLVAVMFVA